jgi:hypothetical protein
VSALVDRLIGGSAGVLARTSISPSDSSLTGGRDAPERTDEAMVEVRLPEKIDEAAVEALLALDLVRR